MVGLLKERFPEHFLRGLARVLFHVLVVALSGGIAFSLPFTVGFMAQNFFIYWSLLENNKIFLISVETALAILLLLLFNYISRSWKDRRISRMARGAGLVNFFPTRRLLAQGKIKKLKEAQGFTRDAMVISSTGYRTFVDPGGDLHSVLQNCREAKIMLVNPHSEGARTRASSILDPNVTPENFSEQVRKSIDFLKGLKAIQKSIKLKLYEDSPFLKLVILGDYLWMKHYHPGLDILSMPEFVFEHDQNPGSIYAPLYRYFLTQWENPGIPEYDFDTDELVYRDLAGNEIGREKFNRDEDEMAWNSDNGSVLKVYNPASGGASTVDDTCRRRPFEKKDSDRR